MTVLFKTMGKHSEWRKIAKKARRQRIRRQHAKERDCALKLNTKEYKKWLHEQEMLELLQIQQIDKLNKEENEKWLQAEKLAMDRWQEFLENQERLYQRQREQEIKLKMEWELEQKKKEKEKQRIKEIEEENKKKQQLFMNRLEQFLTGDLTEPPVELMIARETRPNTELCPFFSKTACCRFGDQCSRNHRYPGISKVLLATNFYVHFGLNNASSNEYDTDVMLEYEDSDTYKEFKDFFYDVLPEFEKFGKITQFKVCNNYEKHLRGNTYIEFDKLHSAVAAYRSLHSRWYGGRQLSLQFCHIISWKNAICGLEMRKRCPKGRSCNFLHVFRNPSHLFASLDAVQDPASERNHKTTPRSWRWSESPEKEEFERKHSSSSSDRRRLEKKRHESRKKYSEDKYGRHLKRKSSERNKARS